MTPNSQDAGVIAIVRLRTNEPADEVLEHLVAGGITAVEVTLPSPGSLAAVRRWRSRSDVRVGVGTVISAQDAERAIEAGAQFLVTPTTSLPVLSTAGQAGVPVACGALTPTEIQLAWDSGAWSVKVFPIDAMGGARYIRNLKGPLPDIPLVPTGGVTVATTTEYAEVGCVGVGIGSALVDEATVAEGAWERLRERAGAFVTAWEKGLPAG
ncbi:MAG TPA: bifunctional 4-hydroxy-2-oxoglutarate aldolase/2-dehydro-3-deoxy-phosphogluconate aldolase [Pseudonocardiaceae bacterium]|nr:bifunctional 4-hydroxy-2-oxoglutarate aldolase/2-dehydro-3-deoxy-phosphogluconate aldolase [Pseudonocardiaceae bacterium]